jgi:hypothetical protein
MDNGCSSVKRSPVVCVGGTGACRPAVITESFANL